MKNWKRDSRRFKPFCSFQPLTYSKILTAFVVHKTIGKHTTQRGLFTHPYLLRCDVHSKRTWTRDVVRKHSLSWLLLVFIVLLLLLLLLLSFLFLSLLHRGMRWKPTGTVYSQFLTYTCDVRPELSRWCARPGSHRTRCASCPRGIERALRRHWGHSTH